MLQVFHDRVRDITSGSLEGQVLPGQWSLLDRQEVMVSLNSVVVQKGDFLIPDSRSVWSVKLQDIGQEMLGFFNKAHLPEETEIEGLCGIGEKLLKQEGATWREWLYINPLVPGLQEDIQIQPLDRLMVQYIGHLECVCHKPRSYLKVQEERVPLSRARRIPDRAPSFLSSHTEDWERRTLWGVMPRRILSELRDEELDIYENRVAARLVDRLQFYVDVRLERIKRRLQTLSEMMEDQLDDTPKIYHCRLERICKLWGERDERNEALLVAEETKKILMKLKKRIMGLMDSLLYRAIPRGVDVPNTIKKTNILANDQHYRRVADLWIELSKTKRSKSLQEIYDGYQLMCHSHDAFVMLLLIRALDQLGYEPAGEENENVIDKGVQIRFAEPNNFDLQWENDGTFRLTISGETILRIIPMPATLGASAKDEQVNVAISKLGQELSVQTMVFYLGVNDCVGLSEQSLRRIQTVGNDPRLGLPEKLGLIPISPWDIGSVERVARALRWILNLQYYKQFPRVITLGEESRKRLKMPEGWVVSNDDGFVVIRPPEDREWKNLGITEAISKEEVLFDEKKQAFQTISEDAQRKRGNRRERVRLNSEKTDARREMDSIEKALGDLKTFADQLHDAIEALERLLICPICGVKADSQHFKSEMTGYLSCECSECRAKWGTQRCNKGHLYPVLLPSLNKPPVEFSVGWEDRFWGCDILALPVVSDGQFRFVCPECGDIN